MKFLIVMFVCAVFVGGALLYKVLHRGLPGLTTPALVSSPESSSPQSVPSDRSAPRWTVRKEIFRGIVGDAELRTVDGEYRVGSMSPAGFCEGIDAAGRVARLRDANGALIYVVAVEERSAPALRRGQIMKVTAPSLVGAVSKD